MALVPTLFLSLLVFPLLYALKMEQWIAGQFGVQLGIIAVMYVIGFLLAGTFSNGALRVLAGVAASRQGTVRATPARAAVAGAGGRAVPEQARGLSAEKQMQAASTEATSKARAERRERRKARKARDANKPIKRKRRF